MILTEIEARREWCPMVRYQPMPYNWIRIIIRKSTGWLNTRETATRSRCIASDCMMWTWELKKEGEKWVESDKGYCGLAGG